MIFLNKFYIFKNNILFFIKTAFFSPHRFCKSSYLFIRVQLALNFGDHWSKIYISKAGLSFPSVASTLEFGNPFTSFLLMGREILYSSVQYLQTNSGMVRQNKKSRHNFTFFLNHSFCHFTSYNLSYSIIKKAKNTQSNKW